MAKVIETLGAFLLNIAMGVMVAVIIGVIAGMIAEDRFDLLPWRDRHRRRKKKP